jgi:hypothetical protein
MVRWPCNGEVGKLFGRLHYSAVSKASSRLREGMATAKNYQRFFRDLIHISRPDTNDNDATGLNKDFDASTQRRMARAVTPWSTSRIELSHGRISLLFFFLGLTSVLIIISNHCASTPDPPRTHQT